MRLFLTYKIHTMYRIYQLTAINNYDIILYVINPI